MGDAADDAERRGEQEQEILAMARAEAEFTLDGDVIAPREKKQRYRIYRVKNGGAPDLVATCRTQGAVGTTLCRLGAEGEFLDYCVGLLDGMDHKNAKGDWIGKWLILPWQASTDDGEADAVSGVDAATHA